MIEMPCSFLSPTYRIYISVNVKKLQSEDLRSWGLLTSEGEECVVEYWIKMCKFVT